MNRGEAKAERVAACVRQQFCWGFVGLSAAYKTSFTRQALTALNQHDGFLTILMCFLRSLTWALQIKRSLSVIKRIRAAAVPRSPKGHPHQSPFADSGQTHWFTNYALSCFVRVLCLGSAFF